MPEVDNEIAEEVEATPSWVTDGTDDDDISIDGEDISKAEQREPMSDVIEPAKDVEVIIKSIRVNKFTPNDSDDWKLINLEPMLVIGPKGVDGKGKYANKHFFPRILAAVNREAYDFTVNAAGKPTTYYDAGSGSAFGDYNAFLLALGFKTNPAPKNDKAFRDSLVGRKITVDILKDRRRAKNQQTGKYEYVDEYENKLMYKPGKAQVASASVEAAAS